MPSTPKKRESQVLTRRERAERQAQRTRQQRLRIGLLGVGAFAVVAVLVGGMALLAGAGQSPPGQAVPIEGFDHVPVGTAIEYDRYPPSSGTHYPQTARYGVHEEEVPEGFWIHNLEHGAIVVLYNCPEGCPELVEELRDAHRTFPPSARFGAVKMVVAPYPRMESRLAYLAWGWEYLPETYDRDELFRFYQAHLDRGPELAP